MGLEGWRNQSGEMAPFSQSRAEKEAMAFGRERKKLNSIGYKK